jgi:hypothetical protein
MCVTIIKQLQFNSAYIVAMQGQQVATVQKSTQNVAAGSGSSNVSATPGSTQQVVNVKAPAGVIVEVKPDGR